MTQIIPSGDVLGARVEDMNLSQPLSDTDYAVLKNAFADHGVLCFPNQDIDPAAHKAFGSRFGSLEFNVAAGPFAVPDHPELMFLSNMIRNGKPLGLNDAGQAWHTDMSYSDPIAFLNVLYAIEVPVRDGVALGDTLFANLRAAYADLPADVKQAIDGRTATHDFSKLWEAMRTRPGSIREPLTDTQRRQKPPVSHPLVLTHPVNGKKSLYCDPGYTVSIDGLPSRESSNLLEFLFEHQQKPQYIYAHKWTRGDVLAWDNLWTIHNAVADYGPDEHRLMRRCQVMADKVFAGA